MNLLIGNLLLAAGAALSLPFLLSSRGWGPEGPVGAVFGTAPLALLQSGALYLCIRAGAFDWAPGGRTLLYALLFGYFLVMTWLPVAAPGRGGAAMAAKAGGIVILVAAFAALNLQAAMRDSLATRAIIGAVLGVTGLSGWLIVGAVFVEIVQNNIRQVQAQAEREQQMDTERIAWEKAEYANLPADAKLWQLMQHCHARDEQVRRDIRARILALPDLEADTIALLGTGWAEHSLAYLRDVYPLPPRKLAPAYAKFLDQQLASWRASLTGDENAGKWEPNLHPLFDVAEKIAKDGGDLRLQLEAWQTMLKEVRGLGGVSYHVNEVLKLDLAHAK
ncbi:MAG: hypothetical protein JNL98_29755 [Bryobacterales bacterium]|nr:hypothetical protein [Bryobacterales bacterium]